MTRISSTAANVVVISLECTLYGIFLVLSLTSLVLLVRRRDRAPEKMNSLTSRGSKRCLCGQWLVASWQMCKSPLLVATVLFVLAITAVRRMSRDHVGLGLASALSP